MSVVKMVKTTVLAHADDTEEVLEQLQEVGVVHVTTLYGEDGSVHPPHEGTGNAVDKCRQLERIARALANVSPAPERLQEVNLRIEEMVDKVQAMLDEREEMERRLGFLDAANSELSPWGEFDPEVVRFLESKGIPVVFCAITRDDWQVLDKKSLSFAVVRETADHVYAVFFDADPSELHISPLKLPSMRLSEIRQEREKICRKIGELNREMGRYAHFGPLLKARMGALKDRVEVLQAMDKTLLDGPVSILQGFVPAEDADGIRETLAAMKVAIRMEDPELEEDVPVKLKNNWFNSGFEAILKAFSGLHYREKDVSWVVGILFIVFGSLCLLDAGYGLMLLITGLWLKTRGNEQFFRVFAITGFFALILGLFSGQAFGLVMGQHVLMDQQPVIPLSSDPLSCFIFSLIVGILSMGFSYCVAIWQRGLKTYALGSLMLVLSLGVFAATDLGGAPLLNYLLSNPTEDLIAQVASVGGMISGVLLVLTLIFWVLYPDPVFGKASHVPNVIWTVYSGFTGLIQDILSHMRLFGIALSGAILALVVNKIGGLFPIFVTVVFALVGHFFVYLLALLSLYIHTNRLIFLEVGTKCIDGGQNYYNPLHRSYSI